MAWRPEAVARSLVGAGLLLVGTIPAAQAQDASSALQQLEQTWLQFRDDHDQLGITRNLGATVSPRGIPAESLAARSGRIAARIRELIARVPATGLSPADSGAFGFLQEEFARLAGEDTDRPRPDETPPDCSQPYPSRLRTATLEALTARTFACYGAATRNIVVGRDTLDRLAILGLLGRTDDPARRQRLFLALQPIWRAVNGDDGAASPYRRMVALRRASWGAGSSPMTERARELGVEPDTLERWLTAVLEGWRAVLPDTLVEPWDFYYRTGETARRLSGRIPRDSLELLANRFYRDLGADPLKLRVHYDLMPRPGKYPISFTDFGGRDPVEPWIFTSYRTGGFDMLAELLHEVGHAVHIAAIRTRGAYLDWPDSDTFTEAIADLAAHEASEPDWQEHYLGTSVPERVAIRDKYAGIVLDVAWSLFEIRVHRNPTISPNRIWTEITREYLRIRPHPEWSWWALRGQLVGNPGYMLNYAFGSILIADVRHQLRTNRGSFSRGDPGWYGVVSTALYQFGHERPAQQVLQDFLGRPVSPKALLDDLARARAQ